ncbi:MAG: hypothetical protein FJX76_07445 [Armatimonadetes bacterium]|nr:hypothetical protein [Armatimonadota bacterium]
MACDLGQHLLAERLVVLEMEEETRPGSARSRSLTRYGRKFKAGARRPLKPSDLPAKDVLREADAARYRWPVGIEGFIAEISMNVNGRLV